MRLPNMEEQIRNIYIKWIRPIFSKYISRQRFKMLYFIYGYYPLFLLKTLTLANRLKLFYRFVLVDWYVEHGHKPYEISLICQALAERSAQTNEAILEAGCWRGGASAKLSIISDILGYRLHIYDSFEGVEPIGSETPGGYDYSGEYKAAEAVLKENLTKYGEVQVCYVHKGWFSDTLAQEPLPYKVRVAFIDCDLAKGTREALAGIVPALVNDGCIFSQDFHIKSVQRLLFDPDTWAFFGKGMPIIKKLDKKLASIRFGEWPRPTFGLLANE
jgi:O-methyltransferase